MRNASLMLIVVLLVGVCAVSAQDVPATATTCDPYEIGSTQYSFDSSDLSTPATGAAAVAMQQIGINPNPLMQIANGIVEVANPPAETANPNTNLRPNIAAIVTNDGNHLEVHEGVCTDTVVLAELMAGSRVTVLDGPIESEGFAWWRIRRSSVTGWVIEGEENRIWLQGMQ